MKNKQFLYFFAVLLVMTIAVSCSTTEQIMGPEEEDTVELTPIPEEEAAEELQQMLASTRSRLSDVYSTQTHDIPEPFLMRDTTNHVQQDPFDGFRVQIVSTRNVELADSVSGQFRLWADSTIAGYTPRAYVFFRQPFYKVHVGDFQDRSRANELSKLIKKKYPEAWVVHDRIDPDQVPADTTQISLVERKEQR